MIDNLRADLRSSQMERVLGCPLSEHPRSQTALASLLPPEERSLRLQRGGGRLVVNASGSKL